MRALLVLSTLLLWGVDAAALEAVQQHWMAERQPRSWTVHLDNDLFAFADEDRDYTAGVALSLGGEAAARHPLSLSRVLEWANDRTRFSTLEATAEPAGRSLEIGLLLFSPEDLSATAALPDDRPYASLAYVASSKVAHDPTRATAYQSTLDARRPRSAAGRNGAPRRSSEPSAVASRWATRTRSRTAESRRFAMRCGGSSFFGPGHATRGVSMCAMGSARAWVT